MRPLALVLFLFLSLFPRLIAQPVITLTDAPGVRVIGKDVLLLEDSSAKLTFDDVRRQVMLEKFKPAGADIINFNVTHSAFWIRMEFRNRSHYSDWYLEEMVGSIWNAKCYVITPDSVIFRELGLTVPMEKREVRIPSAMFNLHVPPDSSRVVYLRLEDHAPFQANLNVGRLEEFEAKNHDLNLVNGLYFGTMIIMLLYNLFIYFSVRERAYLYYVFYILFTCFFISYLTGYVLHFPSGLTRIFIQYPAFSPCLFGLSALVFSSTFLDIWKNSRGLVKVFNTVVVLIVADVVIALLGYAHISVIYVQVLGFIMCLYAIVAGVIVLKKGYRPARFYLAAWGLYMVGLCVYILTDFGVTPFNTLTHGAFQIGSAFEAVLLSVALANKVSGLKHDKEKAQADALTAAQENERIVREQNVVLEQKVTERTQEIQLQKEIIEEKNKDMLSSIHYAKRIQGALIASDALLKKNLPEHFVLYKPKDIVSGDFYWGTETGDGSFLLLTGDCTGHGVPGAFMSLLNISLLNELVLERKIADPAEIFNQLRREIIRVLNPEGSSEVSRDGMDGVLCRFDFAAGKLFFACANNPVWIFRNQEVIEFAPDKQPVGYHEGTTSAFQLREFHLQKGDIIYTFTDGFADQFGGPAGKKFKYKQLKEKITALLNEPMAVQKEKLDNVFNDWKGNLEQVDDVLIIGVRVN